MLSDISAKVLLDVPPSEVERLTSAIRERAPRLDVRAWSPELPEGWADCLLTWAPVESRFRCLSQKGFIQVYGAGVEKILASPSLPEGIAIARLVDDGMSAGMTQYVVHAVLDWVRRSKLYRKQQQQHEWIRHPHPDAAEFGVGIFGMGALGSYLRDSLVKLGFDVTGWRRSDSEGRDIAQFLAGSHILVCLAPLTPETEGVIDAEFLAHLPRGSYLINGSRGGLLKEADLLQAIERGHVAGAALDVFEVEPLPATSPLWDRPEITITPHVATFPTASAAATRLVENLGRHLAGQPLLNLADRSAGY